MKRSTVFTSCVKIEVVRPYSTALALASASSRLLAVATDSTGPKISSWKIFMPGVTSSKIVGAMK